MKKILTIILSTLLLFGLVTAYACDTPDGDTNLTFYAPDGAPALAIAKFINDEENFGINASVSYNVVSSDKIGGVMQQGLGDFIVMPVNAASKLYNANNDDKYVMASVITHGNLYIVSDGEISIDQLKGKVIGVIGQGLVPDLTFKAVLSDRNLLNDLEVGETASEGKIRVRYFASAGDMLPLLKQGKLSVGLVPEPALSKLTTTLAPEKDWSVLDLQELYDEQIKAYPQAVLMVKKSVYDAYKNKIDNMGDLFSENVNWIKQNTASAVNAVNSKLAEGVTASLSAGAINQTVVDNCKIYWQSSEDAKQQVIDYINKIIEINPQSARALGQEFFA